MSIFPVFQTAASGLYVNRIWMDAVADNIANINTVRPYGDPAFQQRFVIAQSIRGDDSNPAGVGGGARIAGVLYGNPEGRIRYEPGNPYANEDGLVRYPDMDMGDQMVQLLQAQRSYQMNLAVVDRARDAYLQALQINGR